MGCDFFEYNNLNEKNIEVRTLVLLVTEKLS